MLKFPYEFSGDSKANEIIKTFINDRLTALLTEVYEMYDPAGYEAIDELDPDFSDFIELYFPETVKKHERGLEFMSLYILLKHGMEQEPGLIGQYVLNSLLEFRIVTCSEDGISTKAQMPEREYVLNALAADAAADSADSEASDGTGARDASPEELLGMYEDLAEYRDIIFFDDDFEQLDYRSVHEILEDKETDSE